VQKSEAKCEKRREVGEKNTPKGKKRKNTPGKESEAKQKQKQKMSCLFESLAQLINQRPELHSRFRDKLPLSAASLRAEICSELERREISVHDVPLAEWGAMETGTDARAYTRSMCESGTWGGGVEIAALCSMIRAPIYVRGAARVSFGREFSPVAPLRVHYTGSHYTALAPR
jgi:hypothetical protein